MPNDNCPLCVALARQLTKIMAGVEALPRIGGDSRDDVRAHALAAICSWWIQEGMRDPTLGPDAIVRCVANCLALEHGVPNASRLTEVTMSQPAS